MSTALLPGTYLIEWRIARPAADKTLAVGLGRIGFQDVILDRDEDLTTASFETPRIARFIGTLQVPLQVSSEPSSLQVSSEPSSLERTGALPPAIEWVTTYRMTLDIETKAPAQVALFRIEYKHRYEMRFLSRMKSQTKREEVLSTLQAMGFTIAHLVLLKKDTRIEERPGISVCRWFAVGEWKKANNYLTDQEPFLFEALSRVSSEPSSLESGALPPVPPPELVQVCEGSLPEEALASSEGEARA